MGFAISIEFHMWFFLLVTGVSVIAFTRENLPLEMTSLGIMVAVLLFGQLFPLFNFEGDNLIGPSAMLGGFSNPSLVAVLALLVMGQGMIHTNALSFVTAVLLTKHKAWAIVSIVIILLFVCGVSAFLNNTPLVIITIPLLQAMASSIGMSESRVMIPLSYAAILGGMMTLIGSSTNLLVANAMREIGHQPIGFFDFVVPGAIMAGAGLIYVVGVLPRFLSDRSRFSRQIAGHNAKEFVAELDVTEDSKLVGRECSEGKFPGLDELGVRLIQRGGYIILPPFEGYAIEAGDTLIVSGTRETLMSLFAKYPGFLLSEEAASRIEKSADDDGEEAGQPETRVLAEIMIPPASRMVDMSLDRIGLDRQFRTLVLGIQRRARVVRRRLGRIRLEAGDVLLITGKASSIEAIRNTKDFIVLSGSKQDLPEPGLAPMAFVIFFLAVVSAAAGVLTIPVAALTGAVAMIATGCLNIRQAGRAIDRKIYLLVGSMLALGSGLQVTGGAGYIAETILSLPFISSPFMMIAVLFLLVALTTNILTNNACAILFTPIAISLAQSMPEVFPEAILPDNIAFIFALTVLFAANCSFASPIGYQTNLLVMGPGHYKFRDFIKAGTPLIIILWFVYMWIVKFYFGVN